MSDLKSWLLENNFHLEPELSGRFVRFDHDGDKNGWLVGSQLTLSSGKLLTVATVGNWKTSEKFVFKSFEGESPKDRQEIAKKLKQQNELANRERLKAQKNAAKEALKTWAQAKTEGTTPYLKAKGIDRLFGCRIEENFSQENLLVPTYDIDDTLTGFQKILPNKKKYFCPDQKISGCFFMMEGTDKKRIWIGEGFATMATIAIAINETAVVAFNAGNLKHVAEVISQKYVDTEIIIVGDDDQWTKDSSGMPFNPGRLKATEAAASIGAAVIFPHFEMPKKGLSDFNDLMITESLDLVKEQLSNIGPGGVPRLMEIVTNGRQEREVISDAWKAIRQQNRLEPQLYNRDGSLFRLSKSNECTTMSPVKPDDMHGFLVRFADWFSINKGGERKASTPSVNITRDLIANPNQKLPRLDSIARFPVLSQDGQIIFKKGYHPSEGLYIDPLGFFDIPEIPQNPSIEDQRWAKDFLLNELLGDFPFVSGFDQAHALAAIVQQFIRPKIDGPTPFFSLEAPNPGTGKSLLADITSLIILGKNPQAASLPSMDDEIRKLITSMLLESPAIIYFDNVTHNSKRGDLDSRSLASAITATEWKDRILGLSKTTSLPVKCLWLITGNNLRYSSELSRRRVPIRLALSSQNTENRNFRHKSLRMWALKNRSQIIFAILILIQKWINEGLPAVDQSIPSFESWSSNIGGLLEANQIPGFLSHRPICQSDSDLEWEKTAEVWWSEQKDTPITAKQLNELCQRHLLLANIRGVGSHRSQETILGHALKNINGGIFGRFQILLVSDRGHHGRHWALKLISEISKENIF